MKSLVRLALASLVALVAACDGDRTVIEVAVTSTESVITAMRLAVRTESGEQRTSCVCIGADGCESWPRVYSLVPDPFSPRAFVLEATGFADSDCLQPIATTTATTQFVAGTHDRITMALSVGAPQSLDLAEPEPAEDLAAPKPTDDLAHANPSSDLPGVDPTNDLSQAGTIDAAPTLDAAASDGSVVPNDLAKPPSADLATPTPADLAPRGLPSGPLALVPACTSAAPATTATSTLVTAISDVSYATVVEGGTSHSISGLRILPGDIFESVLWALLSNNHLTQFAVYADVDPPALAYAATSGASLAVIPTGTTHQGVILSSTGMVGSKFTIATGTGVDAPFVATDGVGFAVSSGSKSVIGVSAQAAVSAPTKLVVPTTTTTILGLVYTGSHYALLFEETSGTETHIVRFTNAASPVIASTTRLPYKLPRPYALAGGNGNVYAVHYNATGLTTLIMSPTQYVSSTFAGPKQSGKLMAAIPTAAGFRAIFGWWHGGGSSDVDLNELAVSSCGALSAARVVVSKADAKSYFGVSAARDGTGYVLAAHNFDTTTADSYTPVWRMK